MRAIAKASGIGAEPNRVKGRRGRSAAVNMVNTKELPKANKPAMTSNKSKSKTSEMVQEALRNLGDKSGSSLIAIKKYIGENYNVDDKIGNLVKRYLHKAVEAGEVVQVTGTGASGSFKLPVTTKLTGTKRTRKEEGENSPARERLTSRYTAAKKTFTPPSVKTKTKSSAEKAVVDLPVPSASESESEEIEEPEVEKKGEEVASSPEPAPVATVPKPKASPKKKGKGRSRKASPAKKAPPKKK